MNLPFISHESPMIIHLIELRRRLIHILCVYGSLLLLFCGLAPKLFHFLVSPLLSALPHKQPLIATQLTAPFLTPLTIAADMAFLCTIPYALLQIWQFILPGLYPKERHLLKYMTSLSAGLFALGVLFCFFIILPILTHFFLHALPPDVRLLPDMTLAVNLIIRMLILFGLSFQLPLILVFLAQTGLASQKNLQAFRPYAIVGAFILGMLLTPPDIVSQLILAVPLCLLYEFGLILVRIFDSNIP